MIFTGRLQTLLNENGPGHTMLCVLECKEDGQEYFRGTFTAEWADTKHRELTDNPFLDRIQAVQAELNMAIESYDDLCLAQAMVADGLDDLSHLGQLFAASAGVELPKTEAFLDSVAAEDRAERAELRAARRLPPE